MVCLHPGFVVAGGIRPRPVTPKTCFPDEHFPSKLLTLHLFLKLKLRAQNVFIFMGMRISFFFIRLTYIKLQLCAGPCTQCRGKADGYVCDEESSVRKQTFRH